MGATSPPPPPMALLPPNALAGGVTPPPPHSKSIPSTGCGMGTMASAACLRFLRTYQIVPITMEPPSSAMTSPAA
eukprot:CAMPEP_0197609714 /NCGR_PEP_ID=MMETSP1326-20131121/51741_1 /TAXON_ID=1155430 /ORGANISM="Genus nov. species nov., Strain RCC2288" /LENGTH=74 /DNA_ID=CAMNT_0043178127 /DNA_START=71 /DNA_END=292 /DNA_ORIENTATION=-